jgi:AraC-like DNA-binding protein
VDGSSTEATNRRLLRARDMIDRAYADPLDVAALARVALVSQAHFIRTFKATFGETPHRYLQRRRIERASALLRGSDHSVSDVCASVGFNSLATFTRTFREIVGETPSAHRARGPLPDVPTCFAKAWMRQTG